MPADKKRKPPVMILCGGQGTRLRDVTELLPKPMVPIGPYPILWHIMKSYSAFGVDRFILCLGYKREAFIEFFLNYHAMAADITIKLGRSNDIKYHGNHGEENWQVTLANTGELTKTGGRIFQAAKYLLPEDEEFFMTYGDAVADVNIDALLDHHHQNAKLMTVTAVHPGGRFGEMAIANGTVSNFYEKPPVEGYINGGFMVIKREFVDKFISGDKDHFLEQKPIMDAVKAKQVAAYIHDGYWQCMDTPREHKKLNEKWESGQAPWIKYWSED